MSYVRVSLAFSLALAAGAAVLVVAALQVLVFQVLAVDPMLLAHPVIAVDDYAFRTFDPMLLANPVIVLGDYAFRALDPMLLANPVIVLDSY